MDSGRVIRLSLFRLQDLILSSGQPSNFKIECDSLTDDDLECLAWLGSQRLPQGFNEVVGIPRGGERFAEALRPYVNPRAERSLLVDDVWTTGKSYRDFAKDYWEYPLGLVIFARTSIPHTMAVWTIFQLTGTID